MRLLMLVSGLISGPEAQFLFFGLHVFIGRGAFQIWRRPQGGRAAGGQGASRLGLSSVRLMLGLTLSSLHSLGRLVFLLALGSGHWCFYP